MKVVDTLEYNYLMLQFSVTINVTVSIKINITISIKINVTISIKIM